ncbi:MAG: hypothetical protein EXS03_03725 [Phycisphaerales bacterium]|nr:hypothetical protein [Phycisphaerales bacterium]
MSHHPTTAPAVQIDDPEAGQTWVAALSGVIILAALVVATCVFYFRVEQEEVDLKVIDVQDQWLAGLKQEQVREISVYQKYTVTAPDGASLPRIRIPVTLAMELVVRDLKEHKAPVPAPHHDAAAHPDPGASTK